MAEFIMKKIVKDVGNENDFLIESAATSSEEIGNDIHPGAKTKLLEMKIPFTKHRARKITHEDYEKYDFILGMDEENIFNMQRFWNRDPNKKVKLLLSYAGKNRDIADPWYTHNFNDTYNDIIEGCNAFFDIVK